MTDRLPEERRSPAQSLIGRQLGAYQVLSLLGIGGMGEVYRARDTRLERDVAIKVLPHFFADHPERLRRFEREAHLLAALNHPHIGAIYGVEDVGGVRALVLELVDGETLADRVRRGPVPLAEALTIARSTCRRTRCGARERHHPPRSQAGKHQDHHGWRRQSPRFWACQNRCG